MRQQLRTLVLSLLALAGVMVLVPVVLVALVIGLLWVRDASAPKPGDIHNLPESSIVYPGASLVDTRDSQEGGIDAFAPPGTASVHSSYETIAPSATIAAYYRDKLLALGYTFEGASDDLDGTETDTYQYGTPWSRTVDLALLRAKPLCAELTPLPTMEWPYAAPSSCVWARSPGAQSAAYYYTIYLR
jgi:hypothetical protein